MPRRTVTLPIRNRGGGRRGNTASTPRHISRPWGIVTLAVLACSLPSLVLAQKVPVGSEFQVNSYTTGPQGYYQRPRVASDSDGNFVVVWQTALDYPGGAQARQFTSAGVAVAPAFQIDGYGGSYWPAVASDTVGNFVVVWSSYGSCQGYYFGMCARQFDSSGTPMASEFLVDTDLSYYNWNPKVASDANGNFVVVWPGTNAVSGEWGHVWARRFDSTGTPRDATEFQVTTSYLPRCCYGSNEDLDGLEVASDTAGNFMVVWNQRPDYVFARVFDSAGAAAGPEFEIARTTNNPYPQVGVASDGAGHFIVVWEGEGNETIRGRRFDSTGAPAGAEFQVNESAAYGKRMPKVSGDAAGAFVVAWDDYERDGHASGVFARQFDSTGTPLGSDFQVNTYTYYGQRFPAVASASDGDFVVVWASEYQDGDSWGVFARRFAEEGPFGCSPTPMESCKYQTMPRRGGITLKDKSPDTKDRLRWKWVRGSQTDVEDFGDPLDETTEYALCIYDASDNPQPLSQQVILGGGDCPGRPCWKQVGDKRFDYRNHGSTSLLKVFLKAADEGRARVGVTGRGDVLDMPRLPLEPPVTVQFQASNGECWEARYGELISKNQTDIFKAKPGLP